ncbi:lysine-specific demethylase 4A isoform X1 [Periophthalmus magnuspinnatus]|uniref:lysine-specific demethylase 4A isoform X1 n=1 Tax=Periophthalmus magnuspinnatus TaxID=409849 RepID=UPI002437290E|nr:lysine-specific demethylase 4A isoform X1 [Periophthalmus magnuspinnatus]
MEAPPQNHGSSKGIMTFHPTMEEFKNFNRYIAYMESQGAHKAGLAKIVPPKEWKPRATYENIDDLVIPAPIQQVVTGQSGLFTQYNIQKKAMSLREFRKMANSDKFCCPNYDDFEDLERKYWKNVTFNPPIYGADVNGSLYDPNVKEWNICNLGTILDTVESESGITIEGVNTPYLYFGMWKTTFAWHTEDMDLYSINYLHFGEPKSWYSIPPEHGKRLERLAKGFFPGSAQNCEAFLRHKMTLISPSILKKYGIPFEKITQEAGQFMVTFPYSYHAGFNHGFNCAESTNFATERWIEYGKQAILCSCRKDMVKISMDVFVRKYQPERYAQWLAGRDVVPIDHSRPTPEAREFLGESSSEGNLCGGIAEENGDCKSTTQRIETKRHRVCLDVPVEVVPKEENLDEQDQEYGKRPRLSLIPPRNISLDAKRNKGPPKLVVTPTKLTLLDPFHRSFSQTNSNPSQPPHYARTRPPSISSQNGHLSLSATPKRKMGVASLLFHRPLSPKDILQVHNYTQDIQKRPPTQLQVHSYAREHQHHPRPPPNKVTPQTPVTVKQESEEGSPSKVKPEPVEKVQVKAEELSESRASSESSSPMSSPVKVDKNRRKSCQSPLVDSDIVIVTDTFTDTAPLCAHTEVVSGDVSEEESYCKSVVKRRQRQMGLPSLPPSHPLFAEVIHETNLPRKINEEWAQPLTDLWQQRPENPTAEREYNQRMSQQPPYCSICLLFYTHHQSECGGDTSLVTRGNCQWSKPLIPEMCFNTQSSKAFDSSEGQLSNPYIAEDGTSRLVTCGRCCVRVHTSCYGISEDDEDLEDWQCARCRDKATSQDCCLCTLRGGALQRANNDKWVHVLCAITVLEARFVNITQRRPVDLSAIPLSRFRLKCALCRTRLTSDTRGCCVQCSHGRCSTAFHPTCAQAAGILMHPDDWPFIVFITCHRHRAPSAPERNKSAQKDLKVGQKVICKHKNGRYYHSEVSALTTATFYEVVFDDGSYSDNLFPEDIVDRDCVTMGPPPEGDPVQVRWTDGLLYGAKFIAAHSDPVFLVVFEDGSQVSAKPDDIYTLEEDLPKRVKSRMSVASDMRFKNFTEPKVRENSKRQRVINSRYREDYIEPSIYRAILE